MSAFRSSSEETAGPVIDRAVLDSMLAAAAAARANAHAPYSGYPVGAAVLAADGRVFAGCNVENAAYPVGTCAEAGALAAMVSAGARRVAAVLVVADGPTLVTPCGACRQRIREFAGDEVAIHLADPSGIRHTTSLGALLPMSFGPDNLPAGEVP